MEEAGPNRATRWWAQADGGLRPAEEPARDGARQNLPITPAGQGRPPMRHLARSISRLLVRRLRPSLPPSFSLSSLPP
ncbi:MAG: hypothetical protein Q4F72_07820, partial [Desulfovibrionaceae bacterium]|nr:hypothetical protein [Desulfovibrionaceae bacterium]